MFKDFGVCLGFGIPEFFGKILPPARVVAMGFGKWGGAGDEEIEDFGVIYNFIFWVLKYLQTSIAKNP